MPSGRRLTDLEPAGFARRASAFLLDLLVLAAGLIVLHRFALRPLGDALGPGLTPTAVTVSLPIWLYFVVLEASPARATLGKRWLGITVESISGSRSAFGQAVLRTLGKLLPFEIAHVVVSLPGHPFIDATTGALTLPAMEDLGPTVLTGLLVALLLLGANLFAMIVHPDGRGAHDLLAGTFIVRAVRRAGPSPVAVAAQATASDRGENV